jgi:hypothetical protein
MTDSLLQLVRASDPLSTHKGTALSADPETVLAEILDRFTPSAKHRRRRRPIIPAGIAAAALVGGSVAFATGGNPFAGIGTTSHRQQRQDVLSPAVVARLQSYNASAGRFSPGTVLPATSRFLGQLTSGRRIYVVATSRGLLCIVVLNHGKLELSSYGNPLTQSEPVTIGISDRVKNGPHATQPLNYGIAKNGITAVSFRAHRREQTVPVKNNVWFYEGRSNALRSITVHYADGRTRTITH